MKALVIEDEKKISSFLQSGLRQYGYITDIAENGSDGLHLAMQYDYDAIILDVMMPVMDGWEVLIKLRAAGNVAPVIILSACDQVPDRVRGLQNGADDYLIKPFSFSELMARIQVIMRRREVHDQQTLQYEDLEINLISHDVKRAGNLINLSVKEFDLLVEMMRNAGKVYSRALLAERVWDINFDSNSNVIDVSLCRLRKKIDGDARVKLIHTIRGLGYVFKKR